MQTKFPRKFSYIPPLQVRIQYPRPLDEPGARTSTVPPFKGLSASHYLARTNTVSLSPLLFTSRELTALD